MYYLSRIEKEEAVCCRANGASVVKTLVNSSFQTCHVYIPPVLPLYNYRLTRAAT